MSKVTRQLAVQIQSGATYEDDSLVSVPFTDGIINKLFDVLEDQSNFGTGFRDTPLKGNRAITGSYVFNMDYDSLLPILLATLGGLTALDVYDFIGPHDTKLSVYELVNFERKFTSVYCKKLSFKASAGKPITCSVDFITANEMG
jgi:hypothetical protein